MSSFALLFGRKSISGSLIGGIAELPDADPAIRAAIDHDAEKTGWPAQHERLRAVDPVAAARIEPNDRQRIQREFREQGMDPFRRVQLIPPEIRIGIFAERAGCHVGRDAGIRGIGEAERFR